MTFTGIRTPVELRLITRAHVIAWRKDLERRHLAAGSIRRKLSALSSLYEFLTGQNAVSTNPVKGVHGSSDGQSPHDSSCCRCGCARVIMDTSAGNFASETTEFAGTRSAQGEPLYAASCIGIGKGSQQWGEEDIKKLEIDLVSAFARGCLAVGIERFGLFSAAGSSAKSWIRYARIMGKKRRRGAEPWI
jgi:hypothetical protein